MRVAALLVRIGCAAALSLGALACAAADFPAPKEGTAVPRDFRFHTGELLPELRAHYTTVGTATGEPVLLLHGTSRQLAELLQTSPRAAQ